MSFFVSLSSFLLILFDSCLGACWKRSSRTNAASFFDAEAQKVMNISIGGDYRGNLSEKNRSKIKHKGEVSVLYLPVLHLITPIVHLILLAFLTDNFFSFLEQFLTLKSASLIYCFEIVGTTPF